MVRTIAATGGSAEAVETDTTREGDIVSLLNRALSPGAGRLPADLIVFNAGNNQRIDFRELSAEIFEDFWRVGGIIAERGEDGLLGVDAIAEAYWQIHRRQRSAWTLELDLRPFKESF